MAAFSMLTPRFITRHLQDTWVDDVTVANITINLTPGTDDTSWSVWGFRSLECTDEFEHDLTDVSKIYHRRLQGRRGSRFVQNVDRFNQTTRGHIKQQCSLFSRPWESLISQSKINYFQGTKFHPPILYWIVSCTDVGTFREFPPTSV